MDSNKKFSVIISKMSADDGKNEKLFQRKKRVLKGPISLKDFVSKLHDEDKTIMAIRTYLNLIDDEDECSKVIMEQDELGNNFLHTAIQAGYSEMFVSRCIVMLEYFLFNSDLATFVNQTNRRYRTIFHEIIYKRSCLFDDQDDFPRLLGTLKSCGFNCRLDDDNSFDILELTEYMSKHNKISDTQAIKIKQEIFKNNYAYFFKQLTDDVSKNKNLILGIFGDSELGSSKQSTLLRLCVFCLKNDSALKTIKRLLKVGIDPNLKNNDGQTFLDIAIAVQYDCSLLFNIIKEAIQYGFDVNHKPTIMKQLLKREDSIDRGMSLFNIYAMLCENGFDSYNADFSIEDIYRKKWFYHQEVECLVDLYSRQYLFCLLNQQLKGQNLVIDSSFAEQYNSVFTEFNKLYARIKRSVDAPSDMEFVNLIIEKLLESRNQSINVIDNDVSLGEILSALENVIIKFEKIITQNIHDIKIKTLNI